MFCSRYDHQTGKETGVPVLRAGCRAGPGGSTSAAAARARAGVAQVRLFQVVYASWGAFDRRAAGMRPTRGAQGPVRDPPTWSGIGPGLRPSGGRAFRLGALPLPDQIKPVGQLVPVD